MARFSTDQLLQLETTCGSLQYELQIIWDEVGECDTERDKMLLELEQELDKMLLKLEQEFLEMYRRKVDQANRCRAQLRQAIADSEAELAAICSAMGEPPVHTRKSNQKAGNLKEELKTITPQLEEMRRRKDDRLHQFLQVIEQIRKISIEIVPKEYNASMLALDESDLSTRKLEDLCRQLELLQRDKSDRLKQVMDHLSTLNPLCSVLGVDFEETMSEIHPTLNDVAVPNCVSNETIERLAIAIGRLREIKKERMQKLQDFASTMLELWNLMDTPIEEQQPFQNVTCNIAASEHEFTEANMLSTDYLRYVEAEVMRLERLKGSKMKELVLKKKTELEELRRQTHLVAEAENDAELAVRAIECGAIDASLMLEQIESQISAVKEEAFSRKEILGRVERWLIACKEEAWLEEYNRDENRYNAGRGSHLTLKRAEKARALVNKIPATVETLAAKITQWEKERGVGFTYDGVRLLSMLEGYNLVRQEKEQERKRQRDQKKLQGQLMTEQEALYGSKPSPSKPQSVKKAQRTSTGGGPSRRQSLGGALMQKHDGLHSAMTCRSAKKTNEVVMLSPGERGLDFAGLPARKLSYNVVTAHQEASVRRKPFAPMVVPLNTVSSTPTKLIAGVASEENKTSNAASLVPLNNVPLTPSDVITSVLQENKTLNAASLIPLNNVPSTPSRAITSAFQENKTPHSTMLAPTPKTPMTVSAPMHVTSTPAPTCLFNEAEAVAKVVPVQEAEYSFEEMRLAFHLRR